MLDQIEANSMILSEEFNTSVPAVKYGLLYSNAFQLTTNWISTAGWRIPIYATDTFPWYFDPYWKVDLGKKMRDTNIAFWQVGLTATNLMKWNARGSGYRSSAGLFLDGQTDHWFMQWSQAGNISFMYQDYNDSKPNLGTSSYANTRYGLSIRLVRDAIGIADGVTGIYVGNNGRVYRTIVVMEREWLADNLAETKFNDGSLIPVVEDTPTWIADIDQKCCAFDNDWDNV